MQMLPIMPSFSCSNRVERFSMIQSSTSRDYIGDGSRALQDGVPGRLPGRRQEGNLLIPQVLVRHIALSGR